MKRNFVKPMWFVLAISFFAGFLAACSKDSSNPTSPGSVAESFESGDLSNSGPTSVFVHTFTTVGSFSYRCARHPGMTGVVDVGAAGSDSVTVPVTDNVFGAPTQGSFPVRTGGYVKWVNSGNLHTVTRP